MEGILHLPPADGGLKLSNSGLSLPKLQGRRARKPPFGTARYYTMRSVYRGRDEKRKRALGLEKPASDILKPDIKEIMDVNLPRLELGVDCNLSDEPKLGEAISIKHGGYVSKHKSYFRIKGLRFDQVYSLHRNRAERAMVEEAATKQAKKLDKKNKKPKDDRIHLPPILSKFRIPQNKMSYRTSDEEDEKSDASPWEQRVAEMIHGYTIKDYASHKRTGQQGRKLGDIVSSKRLQQILDGPLGLAADHFYDNQNNNNLGRIQKDTGS